MHTHAHTETHAHTQNARELKPTDVLFSSVIRSNDYLHSSIKSSNTIDDLKMKLSKPCKISSYYHIGSKF